MEKKEAVTVLRCNLCGRTIKSFGKTGYKILQAGDPDCQGSLEEIHDTKK